MQDSKSSQVFSFEKQTNKLAGVLSCLHSRCKTVSALLCQEMFKWHLDAEIPVCAQSPEDRKRKGLEPVGMKLFLLTLECCPFLFNLSSETGPEEVVIWRRTGKSRRDRNKYREYARGISTKRWLGGGRRKIFHFYKSLWEWCPLELCSTQSAWLHTQALINERCWYLQKRENDSRGTESIGGHCNLKS